MTAKKRHEKLDAAQCALHDARHALERAQVAFHIPPDERNETLEVALRKLSEAWGPVNAAQRSMRQAFEREENERDLSRT